MVVLLPPCQGRSMACHPACNKLHQLGSSRVALMPFIYLPHAAQSLQIDHAVAGGQDCQMQQNILHCVSVLLQEAKLLDAKSRNNIYFIEYTVKKPSQEEKHLLSAVALGFNGRSVEVSQ